MSEDVKHIFVYGTLKVGGHFARRFDSHRQKVLDGTIIGQLFAVVGAFFPAVKLTGEGTVKGEVHRYEDFDQVLRQFDGIEGYREGREGNLYERRVVDVTTDEGVIRAYLYEFNRDDAELEPVEGGEWEIGEA
jgi:gamma-glutamylcyclotransferase (GGCT)/AIG2-like uncharacterized protein YtfP